MRALLGFGVCYLTVLCSFAAASELSRKDKLHALYNNQFSFDRTDTPLITIAINEGLTGLDVWADQPIRVLPEGEGGPIVIGGRHWQIRRRSGRPAKVEYFVVLARGTPVQMEALQRARRQWEQRSIKTRIVEIGTVFGVKGNVFDNRVFLLADGPYSKRALAEASGKAFRERRWLEDVSVISQLAERPAGELIAVDKTNQTQILVKDVLWFEPASPDALLELVDRTGKRRHYRGQIYVAIDREGKLAVVNVLATDQLLAGLVPAEIFPSAPDAALAAQAIAARGNLLSKIGHLHLADPYLTCAWEQCQVYRGVDFERPRANQAVTKTRGLVLMRKADRSIVNAVYHAHCGGFTENNENVWFGKPDPALRARLDGSAASLKPFHQGIDDHNITRWLALRPDTWCARSGMNKSKLRWHVKRSADQLSSDLKQYKLGRVRQIVVTKRGRSGHAYQIKVSGALGEAFIDGELVIRRTFGKLPSSMFAVEAVQDERGQVVAFTFIGGGFGHGAGMCQTGAVGMSKAGKSFTDILLHYYSNSEIQRVY